MSESSNGSHKTAKSIEDKLSSELNAFFKQVSTLASVKTKISSTPLYSIINNRFGYEFVLLRTAMNPNSRQQGTTSF
jgi:hypothetical protein